MSHAGPVIARACGKGLVGLLCLAGLGGGTLLAQAPLTPLPVAELTTPVAAPSIDALLQQLQALQPLPFEKVWRDPPERPSQDRVRLALLTGRLIADGFLIIATERPSRVEPVGRSLLRMAKALGFGEKIMRRSREVIEQAQKERWTAARTELGRTQRDAEAALVALRDDDLVNLIAMGGWLRGLEITATAVSDRYSPERSRALWEPGLADYFAEKVKGFRPARRNQPIVGQITQTLNRIGTLARKEGDLRVEDVRRIRDLARAVNDALLTE